MKIEVELTETQEEFFRAYLTAALWATNDESDPETGGDPLDKNYGIEDFHPDALNILACECLTFLRRVGCYIETAAEAEGYRPYATDEPHEPWRHAGHDFWLTQHGHGCGFWDGDWPEPYADMFDKESKAHGEIDLWVDANGLVGVG